MTKPPRSPAPGGPAHDREWPALAVIFLLALLVRVAYVLTLEPRSFWFDGQRYARLALGLLQHGTYLNDRGRPTAYWPPGYPLFLAAVYRCFGASIVAVRLAQGLLGAGTVVLVHRIARRVLDPAGARLAALATALYPLFIYSAGADMPVTLLIALLCGGVLLAIVAVERDSAAAALGAGVVGAWAVLTAGSTLPAFLLLVLWMAWCRDGRLGGPQEPPAAAAPRRGGARGLRLALLCLLPIVLVLGAWTLRNQRAFGQPVLLSTNGGYNFWLGNHPGVTARTGNLITDPGMQAEADRIWDLPGNEATRDAVFSRLAVGYITSDVPRFLRLSADKLLAFWALTTEPMTTNRPHLGLEKLASILSYGLLLPFALAWLLLSLPRSRVAVLVLLLFVVYSIAHAVILSKVRFRLPLDPFMILYGCGGVVASFRALSRRLAKPRTAP